MYNSPSTDGPLPLVHSSALFTCTFFAYFTLINFFMLYLLSFCFMLQLLHVLLFLCCTFSELHFFILHSFQVAPFTCCALLMFLCCTLFMLHLFCVALFPCCTFFVLHYFQVAHFLCCTLFVLHFSVLRFSFSVLYSFHVAPFFVLFFFRVLLFSQLIVSQTY